MRNKRIYVTVEVEDIGEVILAFRNTKNILSYIKETGSKIKSVSDKAPIPKHYNMESVLRAIRLLENKIYNEGGDFLYV